MTHIRPDLLQRAARLDVIFHIDGDSVIVLVGYFNAGDGIEIHGTDGMAAYDASKVNIDTAVEGLLKRVDYERRIEKARKRRRYRGSIEEQVRMETDWQSDRRCA